MAQPIVQASFNSGEWAPNLWARVDVEKYHSGAAILRNFFVDYRGGASTRVGTKYVIQAYKSNTAVRLIPFQAAKTIGFILEFGDKYIRFHRNGSPVLESQQAILGATQANPCVVTVENTYADGDWVFIRGVAGMTQLDQRYFIVRNPTNTTIQLYDLFGNPVDSTGYNPYVSGGATQRILTIPSPYAAADLAMLKFTQNVDVLILCHPAYVPYTLTYAGTISWTLAPITFGTTVTAPTGVTLTPSFGGGGYYYSYVVTAVDFNGQESQASTPAVLNNFGDLRINDGSITISWVAVTGAQSYNVYKALARAGAAIPSGVPYGYIGNATGVNLVDSNIAADFSTTPPIAQNPFVAGASVSNVAITNPGSYTVAPTVSFGAAPSGGTTATGTPNFYALTETISAGGVSYSAGETLTFVGGIQVIVDLVDPNTGAIDEAHINVPGVIATTLPTMPIAPTSQSGTGTGATFSFTFGILSVTLTNQGGSGYITAPSVTFSAGAATATSTLGPSGSGNPSVPAFFQQRLVLAGPLVNPQRLFMSQPGDYYNYNKSNPVQADDAIQADIVSGQLNNIQAMVAQPGGLIVLTDGASFLVNGGSLGAPVTPSSISANAQSFLGCNDMPPIVVNYDILSVQSKGSSVRDSSYNFYANVYTGTDISVLASHLFFGYQLLEWAWAEEPYKIVWAVRNDGIMLSLTFIKEQDYIAWAHHDTVGLFKSVATIVEAATVGYQNFVYTVVQRTVQGQTLQYIEYFPERIFASGVADAITVDCAFVYSGALASQFSGAEALAGLTVTGLGDGVIIPPFVMPVNGMFTLSQAVKKLALGLAFTADLQTLYLDLGGGPTVQSKQKKVNAVTTRVVDTLGLKIGTATSNLTPMKDLIRGNIGSMTNQLVTDLVTGDARTFVDPLWQESGQYYLRQDQPYPATVLGVFPQVAIGDTPK